MLKKAKTTAV